MGAERVYVHVLIEHQSKVERLMIYRMGAYMWRHWEQLVRDDPGRVSLPAIIPILIHHSDTGWTAATAFEDVIAALEPARAAVLPYVPRFQMKLVDVSREPASGLADEALTDLGRIVLWCLSVAGDDQRFVTEIDRLVAELNAVYTAPQARDALHAVLRYLVATHRDLDSKKIVKLLETAAKKGQKEVDVDVLDELREEGRHEGRTEMLLELLAARFGPVPERATARILAADEKTLTRWSIQMLTAATLAEALSNTARAKPSTKRAAAAKRATPTKRTAPTKRARTTR